ncbi:heat shock transcription factor, X-linked [Tupaia chinensis]|uniref:Heat shock transcription factor, X-linked n=1 Tax=Tupaia chinensis TaxID=246437 RepID=L8Y3J0_TUPCH|nr:heat shock transcription factor, X-linked [Tupaia chinensis]ELV09619.1 Heat shock transcription factor, X-linked [Tupaia chinensis]
MAKSEEWKPGGQRHSLRTASLPSETRTSLVDTEFSPPPEDLSSSQDILEPLEYPDFRLLLEEIARQASIDEPFWTKPLSLYEFLALGEEDLLSLPFPQKLWIVANSTYFVSIWWDDSGTCIGINENLFQKEVLERTRPFKVFDTDDMKSFKHELHLYGFNETHQDVCASLHLFDEFTEETTVYVMSTLKFYSCPFFKKDSPHLLERMRRVGMTFDSRQSESNPTLPKQQKSRKTPIAVDGKTRLEDQECVCHLTRRDFVPLAGADKVPGPTPVNGEAPVTQPANWWPEIAQAHFALLWDVTMPAEFPYNLDAPLTQMSIYEPMQGLPTMLPRMCTLPTAQPLAELLPICHPSMPVPIAADGPDNPVVMGHHLPAPFHCRADYHCVAEQVVAATDGLPMSPDDSDSPR